MMRPQAREAMAPFLEDTFGNPSGIHAISRRAKNALETAREQAAEFVGANGPLEVVFTGGGTEANNLAIAGAALAGGKRGSVVTTATEHEAVLETAAFLERIGCPVVLVGVDRAGLISVDSIEHAVNSTTAVVSVMSANNETGTIQPVREAAEVARAANPDVVVHTDAVQAFISEDISASSTSCDLIALASHKFGGPKGVGLLYVRTGVELEPVIHGGGQELGRRSGTQNVAGIVGMVKAMELAVAEREMFRRRIGAVRGCFEGILAESVPDLVINAPVDDRLVQHSHLQFPGIEAETLLIRLDQAGLAAGAGSACQSGALGVSHVLAAMGLSDRAASESVRFTFGWTNELSDGELAASRVLETIEDLR